MPDPPANASSPSKSRRSFAHAGFEALWAGGCVRDQLLGLTPKDYDVATNATPDQIRDLFGHRRTLPIGAAFGVITVLGPRDAGQIEVATFRTDAAYSDGRHPDSVTFTTAEHDAQRRDFTINGLFFDPVAEEVVDYVGGQARSQAPHRPRHRRPSLASRRRQAPHAPRRPLRRRRFSFTIEPATLAAIQEMAPRNQHRQRRTHRHGNPPDAARRKPSDSTCALRRANLLPHVLPEVADLSPTNSTKRRASWPRSHTPSLALALAALLSQGGSA